MWSMVRESVESLQLIGPTDIGPDVPTYHATAF